MLKNTQEAQVNPQPDLREKLAHSVIGILGTHPIRVGMNNASINPSILATLKHSRPLLFKNAPLNIVRGTSSVFLQSVAKEKAQAHAGLFAGFLSASVAGTLTASLFETPFARRSIMQVASTRAFPMIRFSLPLAGFYIIREGGFSAVVLGRDDVSRTSSLLTLPPATLITATCHKLAMIEATKDMYPKGSVPDWSRGISTVVREMSNGGVLTHPTFRVPIPNPADFSQKLYNFLSVSCGKNMFIFRLVYLGTLSTILSGTKHIRFFSNPEERKIDTPNQSPSLGQK